MHSLAVGEEEMATYLLGDYEIQASLACNKLTLADWAATTDLKDAEKHEILVRKMS